MEITPEVQAQLDEQKKQCPFCKIIDGEIESKKVYNDKLMTGILDINPWVKGHVLLMPKDHYPIMQYIPPETFKHMFGLISKIGGAVKKATLSSGFNIFIANGAVAGQQSPHFLIHILAREKGDGFDKYSLNESKTLEEDKLKQANGMLAQNLSLMMQNHFGRNPASWHTGQVQTGDHLSIIKSEQQKVYEDEKVLVVVAKNPQCVGHLEIYSQEEESDFENLENESSSHMFFVASFAATAVFEGLGAHGSNIILKSGITNDNHEGKLCMHVLPRYEDDGIEVLGTAKEDKSFLDSVASAIKEETFMIEQSLKKEKKKEVINLDNNRTTLYNEPAEPVKQQPKPVATNNNSSIEDEISRAIEEAKR